MLVEPVDSAVTQAREFRDRGGNFAAGARYTYFRADLTECIASCVRQVYADKRYREDTRALRRALRNRLRIAREWNLSRRGASAVSRPATEPAPLLGLFQFPARLSSCELTTRRLSLISCKL